MDERNNAKNIFKIIFYIFVNICIHVLVRPTESQSVAQVASA